MTTFAPALESADVLFQKLDKLYALRDKMIQSNGMSKQFALEALDVLPQFNGNKSMAYYTDTPSFNQHRVALEEVHAGIVALIVAGIAALVLMIKKAIDWFGGGSSGSSTGGNPSPAIVQLKAEHAAILKNADDHLKKLGQMDAASIQQVDSAVSKAMDKIVYDANNEAFFCVIKDSSFVPHLHKAYKALTEEGMFSDVEEMLKSDDTVQEMIKGIKDNRKSTNIQTQIAEFKQRLEDLKGPKAELAAFKEVYDETLKKQHDKLSDKSVEEILKSCEKASNAIEAVHFDEHAHTKFVDGLKKVEKMFEELSKALDDKRNELTPEEIEAGKLAVQLMKESLAIGLSAAALFENFFRTTRKTIHKIQKAIEQGKHEIRREIKENPGHFQHEENVRIFVDQQHRDMAEHQQNHMQQLINMAPTF